MVGVVEGEPAGVILLDFEGESPIDDVGVTQAAAAADASDRTTSVVSVSSNSRKEDLLLFLEYTCSLSSAAEGTIFSLESCSS